jgi:hypothetical protein
LAGKPNGGFAELGRDYPFLDDLPEVPDPDSIGI